MNWADLEKPHGVEFGAVSANKGFPLGQIVISLWRLQRDSNSRIWLAAVLYNTATSRYICQFFFTNDEHAQRDVFPLVELSPRLWALCFDDMTTSRTPWDLTGTSNGGRSFTKSMHRKSALPFGISNSNLAGVIIGLQRSRKAKNKLKSKFRFRSTLMIQIFQD